MAKCWNHHYEKVSTFIYEAGRIIVAISIVLWVLATYGPSSEMEKAEAKVLAETDSTINPAQIQKSINAAKLENSYAGIFGKAIEPLIAPLGFDWKIGIALITSFAAREVFVGTMSTIYSIGTDESDTQTLKNRMLNEINPETGEARYSLAVGLSLMVFYAFALQCMSTLAIVYREMKSWIWPAAQFLYMTGLAYLTSLLVYNLFD